MGDGTELALHFIPDGRTQNMSKLGAKIDAKFLAKGAEGGKKAEGKEAGEAAKAKEGGAKEEEAKGEEGS